MTLFFRYLLLTFSKFNSKIWFSKNLFILIASFLSWPNWPKYFFQFNQIKFQLNTNLTIQYFLIFFQYFLLFQNQKISFLSNRCSMSESKKYCKLYHNLILSIFPISKIIDAANQVPVSKRSKYLELERMQFFLNTLNLS